MRDEINFKFKFLNEVFDETVIKTHKKSHRIDIRISYWKTKFIVYILRICKLRKTCEMNSYYS